MRRIFKYLWITLRETFWIMIAALILGGGYFGFQYLNDNKEVVEAKPLERQITLVSTVSLDPYDAPLPVRADGFITPFRQVAISSQTGGQIVELHPAITERGHFKRGEILARLDDSAERAQLTQTKANIAATQARLDLTNTQQDRIEKLRERGVVAQEQLDQVLSQQAELTASLESLKAAQTSAEIALGRKLVRAPFDGAVLAKSAEVGAVVGSGTPIATIFTNDRMEIDVAIREADAALIPGLFEDAGANASIQTTFAGQTHAWDGFVSRVAPELDRATRTLNVTVELKDAVGGQLQGAQTLASGAPPALINAFATVVIEGKTLPGAYTIPTTALRRGGEVWLHVDGTLDIQPAQAAHIDGEQSFVTIQHVAPNARLITTQLGTPINGMQLRDVTAKGDPQSPTQTAVNPQ